MGTWGKSEFVSPLSVLKLKRRKWKLVERLSYDSAMLKKRVDVPAGFVTDFASVPRIPLAFALFGNRGHAAAVIHDWFYQTHTVINKEVADRVFREALIAEGLKPWRAWFMYKAVAYFGTSAWDSGPDRLRILGNG